MAEVWEGLRRERGLVRYGVLMFALLLIAAALWAVDDRVVREVNVWAKPMKFMAATAGLALTTAVFLAGLPAHARAQRSVQLMVDRGDLQAWKTPGGHRRISRESLERWLQGSRSGVRAEAAGRQEGEPGAGRESSRRLRLGQRPPRLLLIEDSTHFQNLVALLLKQKFPGLEVHVASDGITGLGGFIVTKTGIENVDGRENDGIDPREETQFNNGSNPNHDRHRLP